MFRKWRIMPSTQIVLIHKVNWSIFRMVIELLSGFHRQLISSCFKLNACKNTIVDKRYFSLLIFILHAYPKETDLFHNPSIKIVCTIKGYGRRVWVQNGPGLWGVLRTWLTVTDSVPDVVLIITFWCSSSTTTSSILYTTLADITWPAVAGHFYGYIMFGWG